MNSLPEDHITAAEYALGLLTDQQAKAFEAQMSTDPELKSAYIYWSERLATLASEWPEHVPPEHVKTKIDDFLRAETNTVVELPSSMDKHSKEKNSRSPIWGIAAALVLALGMWWLSPNTFEANYQTYLTSSTSDLVIDVLVDVDDQSIKIIPIKGQPAEQGDYELWVAVGDGAPISLGVLDITNSAQFSLDDDWIDNLDNAHMAISLEPKGGSPTGQPTGPVLAVADTIALKLQL